MAANKRKILEAARKHAQKGAKDKALKEFGKLLKLDPRDSKVRLEMGDTHRRWGQVAEAIEAYTVVADQFMQEGFDARAVAVFKQIQNLQPDSFSHYEPLAELYQRMGLNAEAIGCLESAAESYRQAGQKQEALGLLRKMAAIDPSNTTSRIKVADLLQQEGMKEDAISEYDAVVTELELQGDSEAVGKLFERILEIKPDRVETLVLYARNLIDRGSPQRAEGLAKRALEIDRSPDQFELLADVYRIQKREEDLVALYRELAELYRERGDEERTREILQRHVPLEELGTAETTNGYIEEGESLGDQTDPDELSIGDETTLLDGDLLSDSSLLVADDASDFGILGQDDDLDALSSSSMDRVSDSNEMTTLMPDAPSAGDRDDGHAAIDDSQLLVEASVYLRYGKRSQAIANLESILERDANHRLALEKLGEAHAEGDDSAKAVEMWSRAAKLAAGCGESDAAEVLRSRIAALDAAAAKALDLTVARAPELEIGESSFAGDRMDESIAGSSISSDLMGDASDDLSMSSDLLDAAGDDLSLSDDLIGDASDDLSMSSDLLDSESDDLSLSDVLVDDASGDLSDTGDLASERSARGAAKASANDLPELDLAEVSISDMEMEIEIDIDDASFSVESSDQEGPPALGAEGAVDGSAVLTDASADEINIDDLSIEGAAEDGEADFESDGIDSEALTSAGVEEGDVSPEKIEEDLEEADFYMQQGLLDEAEAAYTRILSIVPNHPRAMVRLGELASQRGDASGSAAVASDPEIDAVESYDGVSEEVSADDIGSDLADWDSDFSEDDVLVSDDESGEFESAGFDVEDSDTAGVAVGDEGFRGEADGVGAEGSLAADLGLDDPADLSFGSEFEDVESSAANEHDETGELPDVSGAPDESSESEPEEVSEEPEISRVPEQPEPMGVREDAEPPLSGAPEGESGPVESGDNFGFDLAAELSESFDRGPAAPVAGAAGATGRGDTSEDGFASVFAEFKKGVSETLTAGDHQAHYDLGIAYREMGLLNDAFSEFRLAMGDAERRVGCLQLMGMCAHEMGEPEQAVGHFTEALASDGISQDTLLAITLDLGKAHEAVGDVASARRAYEEIQAIDPKFADVASRLDDLAKIEVAEPEPEPEPEADDSPSTEEYETFSEFLEDADEPEGFESNATGGSAGAAEEEPIWESFDDVVAELDDPDDDEPTPEQQETKSPDPRADDSEAGDSAGESAKTEKRRKKKISFV